MTIVDPGGEARKDGYVREDGNLDGESRNVPEVPIPCSEKEDDRLREAGAMGAEPDMEFTLDAPIPHPENVEMLDSGPRPWRSSVQPDEAGLVNLIKVFAQEFGINNAEVKHLIVSGSIEVGGENLGPVLELPVEDIIGKQVVLRGDTRTFSLFYQS